LAVTAAAGPLNKARRFSFQENFMSEAKTTRDHDTIRRWAEQRGGKPSAVADTTSPHDPGLLRLDFDPKHRKLDVLTWGEFFETFDDSELTFLYQEETTDGKKSRFHKFVHNGGRH
jgi:hypothetical protein